MGFALCHEELLRSMLRASTIFTLPVTALTHSPWPATGGQEEPGRAGLRRRAGQDSPGRRKLWRLGKLRRLDHRQHFRFGRQEGPRPGRLRRLYHGQHIRSHGQEQPRTDGLRRIDHRRHFRREGVPHRRRECVPVQPLHRPRPLCPPLLCARSRHSGVCCQLSCEQVPGRPVDMPFLYSILAVLDRNKHCSRIR